jgi:hypothetical protein
MDVCQDKEATPPEEGRAQGTCGANDDRVHQPADNYELDQAADQVVPVLKVGDELGPRAGG